MKKVNLKVHPEVIDYLRRVKGDAKAGHTDAEEYWKGAAAGALIAGATNPVPTIAWAQAPVGIVCYWCQKPIAKDERCVKVTLAENHHRWLHEDCGRTALRGPHSNPVMPPPFPSNIHFPGKLNPMKPMPPEMNPRAVAIVQAGQDRLCNHCGKIIPAGTVCQRINIPGVVLYYHRKCKASRNPVMPPPFPSNIHFPGKLNPMLPMPPTMHIGKKALIMPALPNPVGYGTKPLIMPALPNPREVVLVILRVPKRCAKCNGIINAGEKCYRVENEWGEYRYFHIRCWQYHSRNRNPLPDYRWLPKNVHLQRNPFWADAGTGLGLGLGWSTAMVAVKAISDKLMKKGKKK